MIPIILICTIFTLYKWFISSSKTKSEDTQCPCADYTDSIKKPEVELTFKVRITDEQCKTLIGDLPRQTKVYWNSGTRGFAAGPFEHKTVLFKTKDKAPNKSMATFKVSLEESNVLAPIEQVDKVKQFAILEKSISIVDGIPVIKRQIVAMETKNGKPTYWIELEYETSCLMTSQVYDYVMEDLKMTKHIEGSVDLFTSFVKQHAKKATN